MVRFKKYWRKNDTASLICDEFGRTKKLKAISKYSYDNTNIKETLIRFENKYGNSFYDLELSSVIPDDKLVFNGIVENRIVKLKYVELNETEIYNTNSII